MVLERTMDTLTHGESSGTGKFEGSFTWPKGSHRVNIEQASEPEMSREVAEAWERLNSWDLRWAQYEAEMKQMREDWSRFQNELDKLKGPDAGECAHKTRQRPVNETVHLTDLDLQGIFDERARLREKKLGVDSEVERIEEEIRRRLFGKKIVVVGQRELDLVNQISAQRWENRRKNGARDTVGTMFHQVERNTVAGGSRGNQAGPKSSKPDGTKEKKPLKCWLCEGPHIVKNCSLKLKRSDEEPAGKTEGGCACTKTQPQTDTKLMAQEEARQEYLRQWGHERLERWNELMDPGEPPDSPRLKST